MDDLTRSLKQYFGYTAFRPGQRTLAGALLAGRDVLGVMPTGAGKSLCYQLPAVLTKGTMLVISPLISLMKDQVQALLEAGIPAAYMNSSQDAAAYAKTLYNARRGNFRILYVAPERLMSADLAAICRETTISMVIVDEAHCVSQWGQDFRKSYLRISKFLARLRQRPPVGAFTATATAQVRDDIIRLLGLRDPVTLTTGFDRPNLYFDVQKPAKKLPWLLDYLREHPGESGIVYCATHNIVESVYDALRDEGINAVRYHAGLYEQERKSNRHMFMDGRVPILVTTNAFHMEREKKRKEKVKVRFVIHFNMPLSLERYYSETALAGKDGQPADCILLFANVDMVIARNLILHDEKNESLTPEDRAAAEERALWKLNQIIRYCQGQGCRRKALLAYFGENASDFCGNCGYCIRHRSRKAAPAKEPGVTHSGHKSPMPKAAAAAPAPSGSPEPQAAQPEAETVDRETLKAEKSAQDALYERLWQVRIKLANLQGVPTKWILSDASLIDMAKRRPRNMEELLTVSGIGKVKAEHYGPAFLQAIEACPGGCAPAGTSRL